jgi:glycosyltransferase involved in cell wall biosynthesis
MPTRLRILATPSTVRAARASPMPDSLFDRLRAWNRARIHARRNGLRKGNDYAQWIRQHDTLDDMQRARLWGRARSLANPPRFSIVMPVFDPDPRFLEDAIASVRAQVYPHWELCIADDRSSDARIAQVLMKAQLQDARIRLCMRAQNGHISVASNSALAMASGEFIVLLDHDDRLAEHALLHVAEAIERQPDACVLYSDEDKLDYHGHRVEPHFKSAFNAELLRGQNCISHLGVFRTDLVRAVGGFREGYEGAQDHDLALRCTERLPASRIVHVPRVLYHWRVHANSTAGGNDAKPYALDAGRRAVQDQLDRLGIEGEVHVRDGRYDVDYRMPSPKPAMAVIVLDTGSRGALRKCLAPMAGQARIHVVSHRKRVRGAHDLTWHRVPRDQLLAGCNRLATELDAELLALVDSACVPAHFSDFDVLVAHAIQPDVAAAAPRVVAKGRVVGNALVAGKNGLIPWACGWRARSPGYFGRAALAQDVGALRAGCVVLQREVFNAVHGFNARLTLDQATIDLTVRLVLGNLHNRWVPAITFERGKPPASLPADAEATRTSNPNLAWKRQRLVYVDPALSA